MKVAFVLFDGLTALDFIGFYDAFTRLKQYPAGRDLTWDLCGLTEKITDERGLTMAVG